MPWFSNSSSNSPGSTRTVIDNPLDINSSSSGNIASASSSTPKSTLSNPDASHSRSQSISTGPDIDTEQSGTSASLSMPLREGESSSSSGSRYERILRDEEKYQAKQYPSYAEVPGCMQLFDEFMMCYALVPQLRSFYRHAEFRDCTYKYQDFKYCLSLKSESEEKRTELWTKRRAEWWARRRFGGSSEDVWAVRDTPPQNFPPVYPEEAAEAPDVKIVT